MGGIDHYVGAEGHRQLPAPAREVGGDDGTDAPQAQGGDDGQPHRPAADDKRSVVRFQARLGHRVHAHRHRLGESRVLGGEPVRHLEEEGLAEPHVFAIAPGVVVRVADALRPLGTHEQGKRAHPRPHLERSGRLRAVLDDLGTELVAHDHVATEIHHAPIPGPPRILDELVGVLEGVEVRAADPAGESAHQHLAGPRLGPGDVRDHEGAIAHHRGTHTPLLSEEA